MQGFEQFPLAIFSGGIWQILGQTSLFGAVILIILVCFSLVSWSIMFNKWRLFKRVDSENTSFLNSFRKSAKFSGILNQAKALRFTPLSGIFINAYNDISETISRKRENGLLNEDARPLTVKDVEVISMTLERSTSEQIAALEKQVVFLATTANASPFLGLLGTVVGVMDSFWSIGERGSASLAVVAPGIAEALLATIVGLGAAIPAVIGYNWATSRIKGYYDNAANFALEFEARVKKDLSE